MVLQGVEKCANLSLSRTVRNRTQESRGKTRELLSREKIKQNFV